MKGNMCLATKKGRDGAWCQIQIGLLSMYNVLGAENFIPVEAHMELDRACGSSWAIG